MIHTRVVYSKASMLLNIEVCCVVSLVLTPWKSSQKPSSDVLSFFCTLHDLTVNKGDSSPNSILILFFFRSANWKLPFIQLHWICVSFWVFSQQVQVKSSKEKVLLQMTLTFNVRKHPSKEIHPQMLMREKMCQSTSPIHFKNNHYVYVCCVLHHSSNPDIML